MKGSEDCILSKLNNTKSVSLSIIVPVYQVVTYLERCIDSLVNQTYRDIEVILVDDGSTDGSSELCDKLAKNDERVRVIHKENGGLSTARNVGLANANGKYVTFVDSDDWVDLNIYEKCITFLHEYSADVIDFNVEFVKEGQKISNQNIDREPFVLYDEDILYDYLYRGQTEKCPFSVCRKVYLKSLFENVYFPEGKVNEDIATNFKVLQCAKKMIRIRDIGYYYYQDNVTSLTSGVLKSKDFDLLVACQELYDLTRKYDNKELKKLSLIKLARSYFSLLAKAAIGGISAEVSREKIAFLTIQLRKNYVHLFFSPMPLNRKILAMICAIDYRILATLYRVIFRIRRQN
uniref:Glycosyltransferase n=1 Tax=Streptococcus suis TaxID=1307 RepID=A0A0F6S2T8_STRSU|nr:glycosyltransferase [Streptococcus suis]AKE79153.1 glycosyltransferase [Streptococcus suis]AKE80258.1 glycosyltransferase [Streptococcus suis]AKE80312.1 hypothetical protein YS68.seq-orf00011 [Streptococcus suis]AKE80336.1 glycosyltransferase [Streptococcus suis]